MRAKTVTHAPDQLYESRLTNYLFGARTGVL